MSKPEPLDPLALTRLILSQAEGIRDAHGAMNALSQASDAGNTAAMQAIQLVKEYSRAIKGGGEHAAEAALATIGKLEATKGTATEKLSSALGFFKQQMYEHEYGGHDHHHGCGHDHHHEQKGILPRRDPETTTWLQEMKAQAQEHWGEKSLPGKIGIAAVSTVGVGVIVHGLYNVKRGVAGYTDKAGNKRDPSIANLVVGIAEVAGGAALMKRAITGQYGFSPALTRG